MSKIVGLDPSLAAFGISLPNESFTLKTKDDNKDGRLLFLFNELFELLHDTSPDLAVVEDLPVHAMAAGITGMVQGITRVVLLKLGIPYLTVDPSSLKKWATGNGSAKKPQMKEALPEGLKDSKWDDNTVDAYWARLFGEWHLGEIEHPRGSKGLEWNYKYKTYNQYGRLVK